MMPNGTTELHLEVWSPLEALIRWATLFFPILNNAYLRESLRFFILGSIIETGRRVSQWFMSKFTSGFFVTAQFSQGDQAYDWLNEFLAGQVIWTNSREYRVSSADEGNHLNSGGLKSTEQRPAAPIQWKNDGHPHPIYFPSSDMTQIMRWKGYWIQVIRRNGVGTGELKLTIYTRRQQVLDELVREAREVFVKSSKPPSNALTRTAQPNSLLSATFRQGDWAYDWIIEYLCQKGAWNNALDVAVTAKMADKQWGIDLGGADRDERLQAYYQPSGSHAHLWQYKGTWIEVRRMTGIPDYRTGKESGGTLQLSFFTTRKEVLDELVAEAAAKYWVTSQRRVTIHKAKDYGSWGTVMTKQIRPMDSVILPEGLIETIVDDLREFIETKDWYSAAGIPWRRGVLLWGPPGTGKSTTVHAIAGELQLEIYYISLSNASLDDNTLQTLISNTPANCILLLEDIDCAFGSREDDDSQPYNPYAYSNPYAMGKSKVTLSGLLNVLDSVSSEDGRIAFATTNHVDRLDPALLRPGRMDLRVEYKLANREQIIGIFRRFYSHELMNKAMKSGTSTNQKTKLALSTEASKLIQASDDSTFFSQLLSPEKIAELAEAFGTKIPENTYSIAQLQGFLLSKKKNPAGAVEDIEAWMEERKREEEEKEVRIRAKKRQKEEYEQKQKEELERSKQRTAQEAVKKEEKDKRKEETGSASEIKNDNESGSEIEIIDADALKGEGEVVATTT